jgi:hypothetical protein
MKYLLIVLVLLIGCAQKFTIPDEPKFTRMYVHQTESMTCFDKEGVEVLKGNILALREYADKMRKILEGLK